MNLDTRIRDAVSDLDRQPRTEPTAGLLQLRRTIVRRRRVRVGAAVAATGLAIAAFVLVRPASTPEVVLPVAPVSNGPLIGIVDDGRVVEVDGALPGLPVGSATTGPLGFSADGSELVRLTATGEVVALDLDTSVERRLASCGADCLVGVSPDTERVAMVIDGRLEVTAPAAEPVEVDLATTGTGRPIWSPDGARIAFATPTGLYVVDADGTDLRRLAESPDERIPTAPPSWSPDGGSLAYLSGRPVPGNPGGTDEVLLTAFSLEVVDLDGRTTRTLTQAGECFCLGHPTPALAWSPDGRLVAYTLRTVARDKGVYTVPATGGDPDRVSRVRSVAALAWQPAQG